MDVIKRFKELREQGMTVLEAKVAVLKETGAAIDQLIDMEELSESIDKAITEEEK